MSETTVNLELPYILPSQRRSTSPITKRCSTSMPSPS